MLLRVCICSNNHGCLGLFLLIDLVNENLSLKKSLKLVTKLCPRKFLQEAMYVGFINSYHLSFTIKFL